MNAPSPPIDHNMTGVHSHNRHQAVHLLYACVEVERRIAAGEQQLGKPILWSFSGVAAGMIRVMGLLGADWEQMEEARMLLQPQIPFETDQVLIEVNIGAGILEQGLLNLDGEIPNNPFRLRRSQKLYRLDFPCGIHNASVSVTFNAYHNLNDLPPSEAVRILPTSRILVSTITLPCESGPDMVIRLTSALRRHETGQFMDDPGLGLTPGEWMQRRRHRARLPWDAANQQRWARFLAAKRGPLSLARIMYDAEGERSGPDETRGSSFTLGQASDTLEQVNKLLLMPFEVAPHTQSRQALVEQQDAAQEGGINPYVPGRR